MAPRFSASTSKGPSRGPQKSHGPPDKSKARAQSGYELRKARKAKPSKEDADVDGDVYEYAQEVSTKSKGKRRAQVGLDLDRDEAKEFGVDQDGGDMEGRGMDARLLGSDEELGSDDDEEVDSDAAFEESDEERYAGFFGKGYREKAGKARGKDIDLSEGDDDEEEGGDDDEGEDDEFLDVLDIMDGRGVKDDQEPEKSKAKTKPKALPQVEDDDDGDESMGDDEDDEDEDDEVVDEDEDMEDDGDMDALASFVNSLPTKRKPEVADDEPAPAAKKKRRILPEHRAAGPENEFRAVSGDKLTIDDLLSISGKPLPAPLPAPLPLRAQERVDREAAYAATKAEVDKWGSAVRRVHDAEFISFPLQGTKEGRVSAPELAASFTPRTPLESGVDALLKAARLRDEDVLDLEDERAVSVEDIKERRRMLRERRELMFRAEQKMKRVKKIKSRVYRRLHRDKGGKDDDEEVQDREKMEVDRAKERATLRHKNTGRWGRPEDGQSGRDKVEAMLEQGEKLRRRIQGKGDESSSESDDDEERDAFDELQDLRAQEAAEEDIEEDGQSNKKKGVMDMKFMRDALKRKDAEAQGAVDSLIQEIGGGAASGDEEEGPSGVVVERTGTAGRMVYRPGVAVPASASTRTTSTPTATSTISNSTPLAPVASDNPWLAPSAGPSAPTQKSKKNTVVDKNTKAAARSVHKLKSKTNQGEDDSAMEITTDNVLTLSAPAAAQAGDDEEDEDETIVQETLLAKGQGKGKEKAFAQRDLVKQAFAGDDVVREFAALKAAEVERDAPKVVDNTLPGWGSWGGVGFADDASKPDKKGKGKGKFIEKAAKTRPKPKFVTHIPGTLPSAREDAGKAHVIISQKVDKKFSEKYMVKDLPFPYTSKAQYDAALGEGGLGREWNTRVGFQRGTRARVTKKMGQVIEPLEKLHS